MTSLNVSGSLAADGNRSAAGVLLVGNFLSASTGVRGLCEDLAERLPSCGFRVLKASSRPGRLSRLAEMLLATGWRRNDYAVAHVDVFSGPAFVWAEAVCALLDRLAKPYVLTLHGGNLPSFARRWPGRFGRLVRRAAIVTTPSTYLRDAVGEFRSPVELLPNPLDLSSYQYVPRVRPRPHLVWLRAFHQVYDPTLAVRTLARLADAHPEARLTMIGPDKADGSLEAVLEEVEHLAVAERLTLVGPVRKSEVPSQLQVGDIFINTSRIDNTPVSVLEPMASGLPVVSTNAGGLPDLLAHGRDALLVPSGDPAAMAASVSRLIEEPGLARKLVLNARAKVEKLDWSLILPRWQELLLRAAGLARDTA